MKKIKNNTIKNDLTPRDEKEDDNFNSKFLNKKKSVVNIVKIPLVPHQVSNSYKINKKLLQPLSLNSQINRYCEK